MAPCYHYSIHLFPVCLWSCLCLWQQEVFTTVSECQHHWERASENVLYFMYLQYYYPYSFAVDSYGVNIFSRVKWCQEIIIRVTIRVRRAECCPAVSFYKKNLAYHFCSQQYVSLVLKVVSEFLSLDIFECQSTMNSISLKFLTHLLHGVKWRSTTKSERRIYNLLKQFTFDQNCF